MSAKIFGPNGTELEIEATSKAARVILYDVNGNPIPAEMANPLPVGKYATRIEIIPTLLTADAPYLSIYNPGPQTLAFDKAIIQSGYIGTNQNAAMFFKFEKYSSAIPYIGGAAIVPSKFKASYPNSSAIIHYVPGGLTVPAPVPAFDPYFHEHMVRAERTVADAIIVDFAGGGDFDELFFIEPGSGLVIRAETAILSGAILSGSFYWHEYNL